ncbi:MAG: hypothetical protein IPF47_16885 [Gemmatimonadetes bacterium]|nr:hypothetical protein [Gemmatimonadota bacterium]
MRERHLHSHGSWLSFTLLPFAFLLAIVACKSDTDGMPKAWRPLELGDDWRCPAMAGRYIYAPEPISWQLAGRHVPWDSVPAELSTSPSPDRPTRRARGGGVRGRPHARDSAAEGDAVRARLPL